MIGCEAAELPALAPQDATAIACNQGFVPGIYLVVPRGEVAQAISVQAAPGGTIDAAASLEAAAVLLEAAPVP
jgi:hypothetical protein